MGFPVVSADVAVQAHYEACRREGTEHALAEMFALGQPPMSNTDREFLQGHCNGGQFASRPEQGDYYREVAEGRGQSVKGKVYVSGLAAYPGDPRAWVSGRGDVQKVCEERGYSCEGAVKVKAPARRKAPEEIAVADDLIDDQVRRKVAKDPSLARKPAGEVRAEAKADIVPHWAKGEEA